MSSLLPELLDSLDQGIGICELNSLYFVEANATLLSWLEPSSEIFRLTDYISQDDVKRIQKSIERGRTYRFTSSVHIKSRKNYVDFNTSVTKFPNGKSYLVLQGIVNNSEIELQKIIKQHSVLSKKHTELKEKEQQKEIEKAELTNNVKSLFLATMSHEIRTPMNGILGVAQQLRKTKLSVDQVNYLDMIDTSGKQLLVIINEILDFSKLDSKKVKLIDVDCDLKTLLIDVVSIYASGIESIESLVVRTHFEQTEYPHVLVDEIRLKQVIMNLVNNSVKFTETGLVEVSLDLYKQSEGRAELAITVSDNGIGMEQHKIEGLFEAFTQHDSSSTRRFGGAGLGLSICSQIIALMGGEIAVTSELGKGSQFKVLLSLPLSKTHSASAIENTNNDTKDNVVDNKDHHPSIDGLSLIGKKILIAEDTNINREIIKMAFGDSGVDLLMAENGEEAVQLFKENQIDLILMDCLMPVMDGFKATKIIRGIEAERLTTCVPIIAITASTSDEVKKLCLESGMDEIMHKPFSFEDIVKMATIYSNGKGGLLTKNF